ncbi:MAG: VWA domain-containing protein [Planctomycetales bacterium]|nr:VWA domain-containing protein [Planctomycetales bacterium]
MPLELTRPWALASLLVLAPVVAYYFARSLSDFPRPQRVVSLIVRLTLIALLVLALGGLTLLRDTRQRFIVFLLDQSTSVGESAQAKADAFLDEALAKQGRHQAVFLPFASEVGAMADRRADVIAGPDGAGAADDNKLSSDEPSSDEPSSDESDGAAPGSDEPLAVVQTGPTPKQQREERWRRYRDGTNLASAIEAAVGYLPPGYVPEIVVLSDGNTTDGDALAAAARSRAPISTVPLPTRTEPEVQVSEVVVPAEVREGEPFYVEAVIFSNHPDKALVEIFKGDHKVVSEEHELKVGENRLRFQQSIERARLAAYTVRVTKLSEDTLLDNNSESGLVFAAGKPRVLIIESDPNLIRDLAYALEQEGVEADVRPPQGMPDSLADLQNYELLMLSNVPATSLTGQQMELVRTYVQQLGGGFMMLGGEQSFGLGGYYKTSLEEILPVRSDFQKEKETPSLAMVLVIDKSGSMSGEKMEMAKSAARGAGELLGRRDKLGVLAFDGETYLISELQSADNKAKISDEIARIEAGGGTSMYPGMEQAYEMLQSASAKLKHVIVLTDGVSAPGDFEGIAQEMASQRITVSTVAVGEGADVDLLESIARAGKGRYHFTNDATQIPQIFAKETVTASKSAINEQPFLPQTIRATHALKELDMETAPFLLGFVMTRPKPTCEVILATESGDPLLAWWRYGLGMATAFTSDAKSRWAAEWITWEGYSKFWTQIVRQTMRKSDARGVMVHAQRRGQRAVVEVDAVDDLGQFLNQADVELTVIDPQLKRQPLRLRQTAPGRYLAEFATPRSGPYHLDLAVGRNERQLYRQSRGLTVGYSDELRIQPTNEPLLRSLAERSGGRYDPTPASLFEDDERAAERPTPLWPHLVTAALLLLIVDVALRRIDFGLLAPFRG